MYRMWKRVWSEEEGQNTSEFALILVLLTLIAAAVAGRFGVTLNNTYSTVQAAITSISPAESTGASSSDSGPSANDGSSAGNSSSSPNGSGSGNAPANGSAFGNGQGLGNGHGSPGGRN